MTKVSDIYDFYNRLCEEAEYEPNEGQWYFRNGGECCRCTDVAIRVAKTFSARVVGYYSINNPSAHIGLELCEGHDFALISDRFLVDIWAYKVAKIIPKPVFDLEDAGERKLVKYFYGDFQKWDNVPYENSKLAIGDKL